MADSTKWQFDRIAKQNW